MQYYKIDGNNKIIQIQPNEEALFKQTSKGIVCGMVDNLNDTFSIPPKTQEQIQIDAVAHYKSLYLNIVQSKLDELDYDSLATVKLWEGDATFGEEATRILTWYKAIILKNYQLLTAGVPMTDEEYLAEINGIVF